MITIYYKINDGEWQEHSISIFDESVFALDVNAGDVVQIKADTSTLNNENFNWDTDFKFNASGNPVSLFAGNTYMEDPSVSIHGIFLNKLVVNASEVLLPKNVTSFESMFAKCQYLVSTPSYPYKTIEKENLFSNMYSGCTSLVVAPVLPAKKLSKGCYRNMFAGCTSLINAPALPAKTLEESCYGYMFYGCTSLVNAPALPAKVLPEYCYSSMFSGCTSLVDTPEIEISEFEGESGTYSGSYSCERMFSGCASLKNIHLNITADNVKSYACQEMFANCTSLVTASFLLGQNATEFGSTAFSGMFKGCTSLVDASMIIGNENTVLQNSGYGGACGEMFRDCTSLTIPPVLKPMVIGTYGYYDMFMNCISLVTAPNLPATSLSESSYFGMFENCTSLVNVQSVLPAVDIAEPGSWSANGFYQRMFAGCTSLVTAPELPAETLPFCAYGYMFSGCTALVNAPSVLPATTIGEPYASWCSSAYGYMFVGCTSLQRAPVIMAQTLPKYAAKYMFSGCTSLNYIKCLATSHDTGSITNSTLNWVSGVGSTGTFVKHPSASWAAGVNGRPSGWTVQNESQ